MKEQISITISELLEQGYEPHSLFAGGAGVIYAKGDERILYVDDEVSLKYDVKELME